MRTTLPTLRLAAIALAAASMLACSPPPSSSPEEAAARYRRNHDYESLKMASQLLPPGTASTEVERLLGKPDHCPASGLCYYSSDTTARSATFGWDLPVGLLVDFREGNTVTSTLQKSRLGPIEE